ncbi:MAG: DUF2461 domain-containing protein, partial [Bacteroidota bacterium]
KHMGAGYYVHIEPGGKSFVGGGVWMPEAAQLKLIRQEIDYNFPEFKGIVEGKAFKKMFGEIDGEALKNLPKGYTADNAAIEYLKMKSFTVVHHIADEVVSSKAFASKCMSVCKTMKPFVDFLNRSLD